MKILSRWLILLVLISLANSGSAIGPIRCGGQIQFRPCDPAKNLPPKAITRKSRGVPAKVTAQSFQQLPGERGHWQGKIQGEGLVHVWLHILKGREPIEQS